MKWTLRNLLHPRPVRRRPSYRPDVEEFESRLVPSAVDVLTYHNDNARTGANLNETILTPSNVNPTDFGKLFTYPVDGYVYAQPLYMANVTIPGKGVHNVVVVATEHDSVYAFDADSNAGSNASPLWQTSFIDPANGVTTVPTADVGTGDIVPEIGITGTPVIDSSSGTLYVVAKTKEVVGASVSYVQRLHALDVTTGQEKFGGPVVISASVPGTGANSDGQGNVLFNPLTNNQRPALLLLNGVVYIGWSSHGDNGPYSGWLIGYNAGTLQQVAAFDVTPSGFDGGIWMSGDGPAADASGNIYLSTGNGTFETTLDTNGFPNQADFGDSLLKISTVNGLSASDYFTPSNQASLNAGDTDFGSGGVVLLPNQPGLHPHLAVTSDKEGKIFLVDRDNLGRFNASSDQIVEETGQVMGGVWSTPAYFNGTLYYSGIFDVLKAFQLSNGLIITTPTSEAASGYGYPSSTPSVSANGTSDGIVWAIETDAYSSNGPAILHAYDASNLATELYNSDMNAARDQLGGAVKFTVPTITNGKVYVGTANGLSVFGNFPGSVSGTVYQDGNANGQFDNGEAGLGGWTVYADLNGNGVFDPGEPTVTTGNDGSYTLDGLTAGTYTIRVVPQAGWTATTTAQTVTLAIGQNVTTEDFGEFKNITLGGIVFQDSNEDQVQESGEPGLQGWTVYIDTNNNGKLDNGEPSTTTDSQGNYSFTVGPGNYQVGDVAQAGWKQTTPTPNPITVASETNVSELNFGEFQVASISGQISEDVNESGNLGFTNNGLDQWTVQLFDATTGTLLQTQFTDGYGNYNFVIDQPGTYRVRDVVQTGWQQTTPDPVDFTITSGTQVTGVNFANFLPGSVSGRVFDDPSASGQEDPSDPGLNGYTIQLYRDIFGTGQLDPTLDPLITTAVSGSGGAGAGRYSFVGLPHGSYILREVPQSGHVQTLPGGSHTLSFFNLIGDVYNGLDFGNISSPNGSYVYRLYLDLLHRPVDSGGYAGWKSMLDSGASRVQVAQGILSSLEYRQDLVQSIYVALLRRDADPAGMAAGVNILARTEFVPGAPDGVQLIEAAILGSDEYYQRFGGGTSNGFLQAIYSDVLNRPPDSAGAMSFDQQFAQGASRLSVAQAILRSQEADADAVNSLYMTHLGRSADSPGLGSMVHALQGGSQIDDVLRTILSSPEYFARVV
jgi:hypothetical protein